MSAIVDGQRVSIGDYVNFKCDIEQGGTIINIKQDRMGRKFLVLASECGFEGGYIGGETTHTELAEDCWL